MSRKHTSDVLVVGAGPVGQWMALLLAQRGVDVRIIDEDGGAGNRAHAVVLHPASLKLLDDVGLAAEVIRRGQRVDTVDFNDEQGPLASIDIARLPAEYPFALTLTLEDLQDLLERRLTEQGVQVMRNHRFAGLDLSRDPAVAEIEEFETVEGGYAVMHRIGVLRRSFALESRFIVGADGPHSVVSRRAGLPIATIGEPHRFAVFEGRADWWPNNATRIVFHGDGTAVYWPLPGNRWRWLFELGTDGEQPMHFKGDSISALGGWITRQLAAADVEALLTRRVPWFPRDGLTVDMAVEVVCEKRLAERFGEGSVWLVGDSAHGSGPLSNQSLNIGLREAHDLAWRMARILSGGAGRELLAGYAAQRQAEWRDLLGVDATPRPTPQPMAWVSADTARVGPFVPATGADLATLIEQVSLASFETPDYLPR